MEISVESKNGVLRTAEGQQPCTVTASASVNRNGGGGRDLAFTLKADGCNLRVTVECQSLLAFLERVEEAVGKEQSPRRNLFRMEGLLDGKDGQTVPALYELAPPVDFSLLGFLFLSIPEVGQLGFQWGEVLVPILALKRWSQLPA